MRKGFFKKYLPTEKDIKNNKHLAGFHTFFGDSNLWHLNRHSVATAVSIGLFVGYLPIIGHMLLAAFFAILFRANLPIAISLVWISNPVTIPPMFYFAYKLGGWIIGAKPEHFHFETNYHWFLHEFDHFAVPLIVGSLVCGITLAILGNIMVRLYWRYSVKSQWEKRRMRRNDRPSA